MKQNRSLRYLTGYIVLAALLLLLFQLNLNAGSVDLSVGQVLRILSGEKTDHTAIIWEIRLPRMLAAAILGGALSVSGFLLQTFPFCLQQF